MDKVALKSKQEVKLCLKSLSQLLEALFQINISPEVLRRAKFNELTPDEYACFENAFKKIFSTLNLDALFYGSVVPQLKTESQHNGGRKLLIAFGYFIGAKNMLKNAVEVRIKDLVDFSVSNKLLNEISELIEKVVKKDTDLLTDNLLLFYSAVKSQIRLLSNDIQSLLTKWVKVQNSHGDLPLVLLAHLTSKSSIRSYENDGQVSKYEVVKLTDSFVLWQKQLPCFKSWIQSVIELEINADQSTRIPFIDSEFMLENYLKYLHARIEALEHLVKNYPKDVIELPGLHCGTIVAERKQDCLLEERIKFQQLQNKKKLQKLLNKLDRKIILVDDQRK